MPILTFHKNSITNHICTLNLKELYKDSSERIQFENRWEDFIKSDSHNNIIFKRENNIIIYPHKVWFPIEDKSRIPLMIIAGNPAPHSVFKDIYYSYEGKGTEHRFWKVLRELNYFNLNGLDANLKDKFINLDYESSFRVYLEAVITFPTPASEAKWNGVAGMKKLFGQKAFEAIYQIEKNRVVENINLFFKNKSGIIIAMQKDAYNALADNLYNIKLARTGELTSNINGIKVIGTPPTRWLHTNIMKQVLRDIKSEQLSDFSN
jgi:hypothetical protein